MRTIPARRGIALMMVLVLIVMISLGAYTFTDMMTAQERATVMAGRRIQAQSAVASGVEYMKDYLSMLPEDQVAVGGNWDNANYFKDVPVSADLGVTTRFSIVSIVQDAYGEPTGIRYGLEDEGAKINVNTLASSKLFEDAEIESADAGDEESEDEELLSDGLLLDPRREVLMMLPGMTEQTADSILDWIDPDDVTRDFGAEAEVYAMTVGYEPANGPIGSLDELLLVDGVTPELLYGADRNHNGTIDDNEQEAAMLLGGVNGSMARGWSAYLTVASKDVPVPPADPEMEPVDLNQEDLEALFDELIAAGFEEDFASYAVVYRQTGPYKPEELPEDAPEDLEIPQPVDIGGLQPDLSKPGEQEISSVLDLIGGSVEGEFLGEEDKTEKVLVSSPYGEDSDLSSILPELMSGLVAGEAGGTGRINLNVCSSPVLSGLPNLDFSVVQNIVLSQDPMGALADPNYLYPTWPLAQGLVTIDQMKALLPFVSGNGAIFRAQVIGYSDAPGVFARAEVVIDASGDVPKVLSWRDLTHLGAGIPLDTPASQ